MEIAAILGTFQSTLTDFRYLRKQWSKNTKEEALLGVSLTGILDHPILNGDEYLEDLEMNGIYSDDASTLVDWLEALKQKAIDTNKQWAAILGINEATAVTCVKPSGTVSQLVDTASGIHPRYSDYYVRTVRADNKDPLTRMMKDQGFSNEPAVGKEESTTIFSFPIDSPLGSITRDDRTAIQQLEIWKVYQLHWCEHKPSVTIYVKEDEWLEVFSWVYKHFDIASGVSFLPHSDHIYEQAPYQEITEEEYVDLESKQKKVDWGKLSEYELEDQTTAMKEYACTGGSCEI